MSGGAALDLCVIGAGSAGLTVAAAGRAVGLSVVLIERGRMGGECLNIGCVPSKALIAAARHAAAVRRASAFGVDAGEPRVDAGRVRAHIDATIAAIAPHDSQERFEGLGARVIRAEARFTGPDAVEAGGETIRARRFVVATGSRPAIPDLPGLDGLPILTNESVFDLTVLPRHLVVLGGGPIGCELAQAFRRLGAAVTIVARRGLLGRDDPDAAAVVTSRLAAEGIAILDGAETLGAERTAEGISLTVRRGGADRRVEGSHLLVATGRRFEEAGLDLAAAGVRFDGDGVAVDGAFRTSNRRVFAIGDAAAGGARFTHWAGYQGGLVVRSVLTGRPAAADRARLAWCTYTDPELAQVGPTEAAARAAGGTVQVVTVPYAGSDRARTDGETEGFVKVTAGRGGRVTGATIVGAGAGELAAVFALAVAKRATLGDLAGLVLPYPTLAELAKRAGTEGLKAKLGSPLVRGGLGLLRGFGRLTG